MRTIQHIVDTKAIKAVFNAFPDHWVIRELTERDYGIDLSVEIFVKIGQDRHENDIYDASGAIFHIQIKGTCNPIHLTKESTVNYSIGKDSLFYVEKFNTPFFLIRADVSTSDGELYFVWLQRYIKDVLDTKDRFWRESSETKTITITIPNKNIVRSRICKIEKIAFRPKYIEELVEYCEIYKNIERMTSAILCKQHEFNNEVREYIKSQAYRVRRLNVLLSQNDCCVNQSSIDTFIEFIDILNIDNQCTATETDLFASQFNLRLLSESINSITAMENFLAENDDETVY